jgi:pimeloyl-ACP methyl ester carboxylesterase
MTRPTPRSRSWSRRTVRGVLPARLVAAGLLAVAALLATAIPAVPALATPSAAPSGTAPATVSASRPVVTPPFANPPGRLGHCQPVTVPVTLPTGQPEHLAGHLCTPTHGTPTTIMLLAHGGTYNSAYWSWPQDPAFYSFVWRALAAGYGVLAIDRLGDGQSSHPDATLDTFTAQAATLHQVITALRTGTTATGRRWVHVIEIGHSFGAAEIAQQLTTYPHDADAVILTGSGHAVSVETTTLTHTGFTPAAGLLPDRFATLGPGYLTSTTQAVRDQLLYNHNDSDPAVRAYDQSTRDTLALTESTTRPANLIALTQGLRIPTLLLDGQFDPHYCDGTQAVPETGLDNCATAATLYTSEKPNYGACFAAAVVPASGHDLSTEYGAGIAAALILRYTRQVLPPVAATAHCTITGAFPATTPDTPTSHRIGASS